MKSAEVIMRILVAVAVIFVAAYAITSIIEAGGSPFWFWLTGMLNTAFAIVSIKRGVYGK